MIVMSIICNVRELYANWGRVVVVPLRDMLQCKPKPTANDYKALARGEFH